MIQTSITKTKLTKKIMDLEGEIQLLKETLLSSKQIDYDIDEKNWEKVSSSIKKNRLKLYRNIYET